MRGGTVQGKDGHDVRWTWDQGRVGWRLDCARCGLVSSVLQEYEGDAEAIAQRHATVGGFESTPSGLRLR
jgi:hypothetical protein